MICELHPKKVFKVGREVEKKQESHDQKQSPDTAHIGCSPTQSLHPIQALLW